MRQLNVGVLLGNTLNNFPPEDRGGKDIGLIDRANLAVALAGSLEGDVRYTVISDIISHLSDIAIRTGRKIRWDDAAKTIVDDDAAVAMMFRDYRKPWSVEV